MIDSMQVTAKRGSWLRMKGSVGLSISVICGLLSPEGDGQRHDVGQDVHLTVESVMLASALNSLGRPTWKTTTKKLRKWSNISVKKYHERPTLGVRSWISRLSEGCVSVVN